MEARYASCTSSAWVLYLVMEANIQVYNHNKKEREFAWCNNFIWEAYTVNYCNTSYRAGSRIYLRMRNSKLLQYKVPHMNSII